MLTTKTKRYTQKSRLSKFNKPTEKTKMINLTKTQLN